MILSSDELEIIDYLKTWNGKYMTLVQICRCAGGRRKFKDTPTWANPFMTRLVEAKLVEVNERGHYRSIVDETLLVKKTRVGERRAARKKKPIANEDHDSKVIGDNYFPSASPASSDSDPEGEKQWWLLPQIQQLFSQLEPEEEPPK